MLRDCCERDDVEEELKPVRTLHSGALKFFRPNHGHERIDEQEQGNDAHDEVSHGVLLQFFAEANVKSGDDEEHDDDSDEEQVTHNGPPGQAQESGVASDLRSTENTFAFNPPRGGATVRRNPTNRRG